MCDMFILVHFPFFHSFLRDKQLLIQKKFLFSKFQRCVAFFFSLFFSLFPIKSFKDGNFVT